MAEAFQSQKIVKVDEELGLVFGWGIICEDGPGSRYFDHQGDHIPDDAMLKAITGFMDTSRETGDMHVEIDGGAVLHSFPLTREVQKLFGITCDKSGWMVGVKPSAEVLEKFKSGEYTGFSIGGKRIAEEVVEA